MSNHKTKHEDKRQRKKIEKDNRRKHYEDIQIQGTNNSSIVSKRSVEMLYTTKLNSDLGNWFHYFVSKGRRRSPAVNRGYWIRMESIRRKIDNIVSRYHGTERVTIVNLGCGFDPLPFQLLHREKLKSSGVNMNFFDLDYSEVASNKADIIRSSPEIIDVVGSDESKMCPSQFKYASKCYKLISCNLNDTSSYKQFVEKYLKDTPGVKIFVAEVSLAYMHSAKANAIIELSSKIENSHFLILEQILPCGEDFFFARKMLYHFDHLRSSLNCVKHYPKKSDEVKRFQQFYESVDISDLFECWETLIDDETKLKVGEIEDFDEWEEFIVFCHHYILLHATNDTVFKLEFCTDPPLETEVEESVHIKSLDVENRELLDVKFPDACAFGDKILLNSGLNQARTNQSIFLNGTKAAKALFTGELPSPRMCHTITSLIKEEAVLIGGRSRPGHYLNDVFLLQKDKWVPCKALNIPRSRHCCVSLSLREVLLFGGVRDDSSSSEFIESEGVFSIYDTVTQEEKVLQTVGNIPNLHSSVMTFETESLTGYVIGGFHHGHLPIINDQVYKFELVSDGSVIISDFYTHPLLERASCSAHRISNNRLLIVGGVSSRISYSRLNWICTLDLTNKIIRTVPIPIDVWHNSPPLLIGCGTVSDVSTSTVYCLGGGVVCYSFGSAYNGVYCITY